MVELITGSGSLQALLQEYKKDVQQELVNILNYWMSFCVDEDKGGFYGKINYNNIPDTGAGKGSVLNARILWTFSAAYSNKKDKAYLAIAERAFNYIIIHFYDEEFGGVYWLVDSNGNPLNTRKQVYAIAFCLYGMSEYYTSTQNKAALDIAIDLFNSIEQHSYDKQYGGYFEAFARDWGPLDDLRLSAKDANEKKTMNTHLHIIEAYANLYKVWPVEKLRKKIISLLEIFDKYIINKDTGHLELFFDEQWNVKPDVISYGHDIEASWLLLECAETIGDTGWIEKMKIHAVQVAKAAAEGLDKDGGLWYEYKPAESQLVKEKHWWPQAEAMVGFFNAWQLTKSESWLQRSYNNWIFVNQHIIDTAMGEWYWGVNEDNSLMQGQDKAGFWKCPYHNVRACMELMKRIGD